MSSITVKVIDDVIFLLLVIKKLLPFCVQIGSLYLYPSDIFRSNTSPTTITKPKRMNFGFIKDFASFYRWVSQIFAVIVVFGICRRQINFMKIAKI